jgi:hypothetical protein
MMHCLWRNPLSSRGWRTIVRLVSVLPSFRQPVPATWVHDVEVPISRDVSWRFLATAALACRWIIYPCQTWLPHWHVTVSVGSCLVNCFLQMGHGLVITYVMVFTPRLDHSKARAGYKFIASSGICQTLEADATNPSPTCLVKNAHLRWPARPRSAPFGELRTSEELLAEQCGYRCKSG